MPSGGTFFVTAGGGVTAAVSDVPDTTGILDEPGGTLRTMPVPGMDNDRYVPWGYDDQLPFELVRLVGSDEVTAQNKLFNVITCYGAGVRFRTAGGCAGDTEAPAQLREAREWAFRQSMPAYFLDQVTDMKYFFFSVAVLILSRDGSRVNRIRHKEACYCRMAQADRRGHIPYVYYANWRDGQARAGGVERIPVLDERDPYGDLMRLMGREAGRDGRKGKPGRGRKFAVLLRFPTAGCQYYPVPYWSAMLRGGSYDEKRLISTAKRAKLRNHTSVKYQVEVEQGYWAKICREEFLTDPEQIRERVRREKENIRDFIAGVENSGKVWISSFFIDPNGREIHDVRITRIDTGKEGGDWDEDVQAAANTICYADNTHPNLVGAVPGKSQNNNSGSDKRELFTMKQALEIAFHDLLLLPLQLVARYNGWTTVEPSVPMIQLTTLDEHRDAVQVSPASE